ncbi:helix-turn-helix domain-containing protein [Actinomadura macrotermitis]|uniref:Helix-turn-helix domain-containing protein n=1 Tax=Actinomadura macrotermitis TaxID=2585200 RepID=A0A7K0BSE3_9ACTN|nr:helix-turn-helix domain-containing protein [Actinomadura macrotermitis]MQY04125.1 hypothetical protein [Actinomadura macrotermitis]
MNAKWTREAIEGLGPTTDVQTAADVLDCSDWTVYELIRRGEWTLTRVLRLGRKIKIPTHDLVTLLYPNTRTAEPPTGPADTTNAPKDAPHALQNGTAGPSLLRPAR